MKDVVEEIINISKLAGDKILEVYADEASFGVQFKKDDSPLTRADKLANDVIMSGLQALPTRYPIISEENKLLDYKDRKNYDRFWLVDPLDGTKEFIKRNGDFTVNIALVETGQPIMGVVHVPVTGDTYWGIKNQGAFHKNRKNEVHQLKVNSYKKNDEGLRVVCSRSHINPETQNFIDQLNNPKTVSRGSSLKFLLIAAGKAEMYPRIGPTMEWDTGAAHIVLEEAGGEVLNYETMQPLRYNKENLLNPYFIARGRLN